MLLLRSLYINDVIHVCEIFKVKDLKDILTLNIYTCIFQISVLACLEDSCVLYIYLMFYI